MYYNLTNLYPQDGDQCSVLATPYFFFPENQDLYEWYTDCYKANYLTNMKKLFYKSLDLEQTADVLNYDCTDNQNCYTCYNSYALAYYLNNPKVLKAFHIDSKWIEHKNVSWQDCNWDLYNAYNVTYRDTFDVFIDIFDLLKNLDNVIKNFRIIVYNGDVDTVCNFLGDMWHMENIANKYNFTRNSRLQWKFRDQLAGYHQPYSKQIGANNLLTLDVLTVKTIRFLIENEYFMSCLVTTMIYIQKMQQIGKPYEIAFGLDIYNKFSLNIRHIFNV
uniref:Uncharacterized protein n=1 Tax=Acrobeloides nanus TaxID=290746 RepID=A0A914E5G4_9BILA